MLLESLAAPSIQLANRIAMAPMTRSRAVDANTPNALMAEYYGQRASADLILTEGTSPSPNGLGYPRIPGLFNEAQLRGWKAVTDRVHAKGGKIFVQLMHTGRVTRVANLPAGAEVLGPTAEACPGEMYTDSQGMQPHSAPRAMTVTDITHAVEEYATSARLAIDAGFDGVELHAANGCLIEQFLNARVNQRTDAYGGTLEGRNRFALEVAHATAAAIGAHRVAIRLSPYGVQQHRRLPRRRSPVPGAHPRTLAAGCAVRAPAGSLGDGRAAGACRVQVSASHCVPGLVHPCRRLGSCQCGKCARGRPGVSAAIEGTFGKPRQGDHHGRVRGAVAGAERPGPEKPCRSFRGQASRAHRQW